MHLFFKNIRIFFSAFVLLVLSACAVFVASDEIVHGLSVANKGDTTISNVVIEYGKITRRECIPFCRPRSGGGVWNSPMSIPETMRVTWLSYDGYFHDKTILVSSRIKDRRRLANLYFEFRANQLTVIQALHYDNRSIIEYEKFPLYP